jgi:hypothetical protein
MVEPARRHGPFDTRYPMRTKLPATTWELKSEEDGLERLDWASFVARFFPKIRRHDFEVLAGYQSYRNEIERASAAAVAMAGPVSGMAPYSDAVLSWEWEGGAVAGRVAG